MLKWMEKLTAQQKTIIGMVLIFIAMDCGFAANVYCAMWGGENEWNLLATALYMLFWLIFINIGGKHRPLLKAAYIVGICTLFFALFGSVCMLTNNPAVQNLAMIPALFGTITTVQFWGLNVIGKWLHIIGIKWYYPSVAAIALCGVVYARQKLKQDSK